jgi:hypothetical protein
MVDLQRTSGLCALRGLRHGVVGSCMFADGHHTHAYSDALIEPSYALAGDSALRAMFLYTLATERKR